MWLVKLGFFASRIRMDREGILMVFVGGRLCSSFEKGRNKPKNRQGDLDRKSQCKRLQKRYASNVKKVLVPLVPDLEFPR